MTTEARFREKINWISLICAVLVVFLHSYAFDRNSSVHVGTFAYWVEFLISRDLAQGAVPVFFAMSAFLFYRCFTMAELGRKLKSRFSSLVIPYLIWNGLYTLAFYFLAKLPFINTPAFPWNLESLVQGIVFYQYNGAFWFLFNLIQLTYLCPLIWLLMKNRWVAIGFLTLMTALYSMEITVIGWLEVRAVIYYGFGAYFAVHHQDAVVRTQKFHWSGAAALVLSQILLFGFDDSMLCYILTRLLMIVAAFWFANLLPERKVPKVLMCSFSIYAMHGLLLETFNKLFSFWLDPMSNWILLDYFGSVLLTLGIIVAVNQFMVKYIPKLHKVLCGGRG